MRSGGIDDDEEQTAHAVSVPQRSARTILDQRTGKLSDVLDVEREITRVRGDIEGMEAQRKDLDRRIAYATIQVTIMEEKKASLDLGPLPVSDRFRNAFVEGWRSTITGAVDIGLTLTGLLPPLIVLALVSMPAAMFLRRRRRRETAA